MTELREKCRKVMTDHLVSKGYPNLTRQGILREVKNLWNALDVAGLMPEIRAAGHTYESFCQRALAKAQESAFDEFVAGIADHQSGKRRMK